MDLILSPFDGFLIDNYPTTEKFMVHGS